MAKQQAILELQVDQSDLLRSAASSKKALLDLKEEQTELNKALKTGTIDTQRYAEETVKLEQRLKKEQATYQGLTKAINTNSGSLDAQRLKLAQLTRERNSLNKTTEQGIKDFDRLTKEIKELNTEISKHEQQSGDFRRNVGNYGNTFKEAAGNIQIAGTSISDITTKIASFANPATAAVGILGGLAAAYSRSTIGAKDLEFAQNQLAAATTLVTNSFASMISSAEDGEGIVSTFVTALIASIDGIGTALEARALALTQERLEDLQREELSIRDQINERLERNSEIMTELQDEQIEYNDKIGLTNEAIANIRANEEDITANLQEQLKGQQRLLSSDKENDELKTAVLQTTLEIGKAQKDAEKRVQAILRIEKNLTEEYNKQQAALAFVRSRTGLSGTVSGITTGPTKQSISGDLQSAGQTPVDAATQAIEKAKTSIEKQESEKRIRQAGDEFRAKQLLREKEITAIADISSTAAGIFDEQSAAFKVLSTIEATINTYKAANLALASAPPPFSFALAAATVAAGLANVAKINGLEFAEGGWTGPGSKYDVAGVVHKDEYVTPKHVVHNPMAQPHLKALEKIRTGYADGGFVVQQNTGPAQQNVMLMNAIKNLPPSVVDIREFISVEDRLNSKINVVKLQP
jgi:predicted  nucleic acid-binding Zn-ribbon protein